MFLRGSFQCILPRLHRVICDDVRAVRDMVSQTVDTADKKGTTSGKCLDRNQPVSFPV